MTKDQMAKEAKEAQIKYIKTEELIPYVNNPRTNDQAVDSVAASIKEFGFKQPIVIDKDKVVVAGHTRLKASKKLGLEEVPCIIADDLTEEQIKAYRLADNKVAESADWDLQKLELELKALEDVDMSQFGFDLEEFEDNIQIEEDDFDDQEDEEPFVKQGQIWKLGEHRLMCGDSTKREDVEKLMDGELADLCVTDPPYNVALGYNLTKEEAKALHRRTDGLIIENDSWKNDEEFIKFITTAFDNLRDFLKVGGVYYIWFAASQTENFLEAMRQSRLGIRQWIIWVKSTFAFGRQDYHWRHEPCFYGWKEGAAHYFIDNRTLDTVYDETPDFEKMKKEELVDFIQKIYEITSIIYENKPTKSELHPTMKPVGLFARLIRNSSKKNERVLDLFGGSGTTLIACEQLGRKAYLMEYDEHYASVIVKRWEDYTGQKAELLNK